MIVDLLRKRLLMMMVMELQKEVPFFLIQVVVKNLEVLFVLMIFLLPVMNLIFVVLM